METLRTWVDWRENTLPALDAGVPTSTMTSPSLATTACGSDLASVSLPATGGVVGPDLALLYRKNPMMDIKYPTAWVAETTLANKNTLLNTTATFFNCPSTCNPCRWRVRRSAEVRASQRRGAP